jgi:Tol biopolymer transport system component
MLPALNRRWTTPAAVLAVVAASALVSTVAHATPPGRNGRIAFQRFFLSEKPIWSDIWITNPDGTGTRQLSHAPRGYLDRAPDWSPDGSHIAFYRCASYGRCTTWTVKPDGSDEKMLSTPCPRGRICADNAYPRYSPDGRQIAFTGVPFGAGDAPGLMVADAHLHHARRVFWFGPADSAPHITCPAWSPDAKRLAFVVSNDNGSKAMPANGVAIFSINIDGTGLRRVTPWSVRAGSSTDDCIDWSPDGTRILFHSHPGIGDDKSGGNLYTIRPNGTGLRQLTHFDPFAGGDQGELGGGSFSPDGSSIVFATTHGAVGVRPNNDNEPDIFVMSADGTDVRPVTRSILWDNGPDWGPG